MVAMRRRSAASINVDAVAGAIASRRSAKSLRPAIMSLKRTRCPPPQHPSNRSTGWNRWLATVCCRPRSCSVRPPALRPGGNKSGNLSCARHLRRVRPQLRAEDWPTGHECPADGERLTGDPWLASRYSLGSHPKIERGISLCSSNDCRNILYVLGWWRR